MNSLRVSTRPLNQSAFQILLWAWITNLSFSLKAYIFLNEFTRDSIEHFLVEEHQIRTQSEWNLYRQRIVVTVKGQRYEESSAAMSSSAEDYLKAQRAEFLQTFPEFIDSFKPFSHTSSLPFIRFITSTPSKSKRPARWCQPGVSRSVPLDF